MNLQELKKLYLQNDKTAQIIAGLQGNKACHIHLKGLCGSAEALIAAAIAESPDRTPIYLFVLSDKEEAAYFLNDMENLSGRDSVLFFPTSYKHSHQAGEIDKTNVLLRAEVLNRINGPPPTPPQGGREPAHKNLANKTCAFIVTYPEALSEKVVTRKHLSKNTLKLNKGEKVSMDFITELLSEYDFEHSDFVIEPGQFSVRGGIIDVFSFSNDHPYRIEFFGDEVASIRTFDPVTQVSISPSPTLPARAEEEEPSLQEAPPIKKISQIKIIPDLQNKLLLENNESFLQFIPNDTVIWFKDFQLTIDKLKNDSELFTTKEDFIKHAKEFSIIEFGHQFYFKPHLTINYQISPQPAFNKNFELLTENLTGNTEKGFKNIILTDSAKQIERLNAIFEDIGKNIDFTPLLFTLHEGFIDKDLKIACYTDHQIFDRYHRFRLKDNFRKKEAITLKEFHNLKPGDYIVHIDHGIGKFAGLEKIDTNGKPQEVIQIIYKDDDILYVSIHSLHRISKYSGKEGFQPKLNRLGSANWNKLKQKTKKRVKDIAKDLIKLYAERKAQKGFEFSPDTYMQNELEASFIYEDTPDQLKATKDTKKDMESSAPMDRLICGDVGFGKTEIAIRAAFKAVADSKQVAVLVPTTILALQHYKTFKDRLAELPCNVDYLNRFKSAKQQKETLQKLASGHTDILIGTHRIVSKDVKFKDIGLLIIDEEQKFGVATKEKLKSFKTNVDTLTLTATPIPRTLQFSLMGARDMSIINTAPPNRYPIQTELHIFNEDLIRDTILYEVSRNGQVFFVHNRVQNIEDVAEMVRRICPDVSVTIGHGQMEGAKLEKVMIDFIEGKYDVLVATTIIESGLDIPNANTIIIDHAHQYGLSDLHQMRGRVGRSNKKAFCYLLTPPLSTLTAEARKRLKAIEDFSDLGSGFNIALRDLDIRGAGNILGGEQSGFITDLGFDMYHKILDEAVRELKREEFPELASSGKDASKEEGEVFVVDCQIDTDLEVLIPDDYVNNITERLHLYKELNDLEKEEDLLTFENILIDRFGTLPKQTEELLNTIRLRWLAKEIGFEKLVLKQGKLIGYFVSEQSSPYYQSTVFTGVLGYAQQHPGSCKMKESKNKLSISLDEVGSINDAIAILAAIVKESSVLA